MTSKFGGSWIGYHAQASPGEVTMGDLADSQRLSYGNWTSSPAIWPVGGTEQQPLNRRRVVRLTGTADDRLTAVFEHMAADRGRPSTPKSASAPTPASNLARN